MRESVRRLVQNGCQVELLVPAWKGLVPHKIDGVPVHRFRYAPAGLEILTGEEGAPSKLAKRPWLQLLAIPYIILGSWKCFRLCMANRPDVVHVHWPFPHGFMGLVAKWFFRVPMVLNFHGAELLLIRKHPWVRHALRFILGNADAVLCNSSFTAAKVKAIYAGNTELSPYGTTLSTAPLAKPVSTGKFTVLFVGRHIERKGLSYLIQAASMLDAERFQIRIVGQGDLSSSLREQAIKEAPLQVVFTGQVSSAQLEQEYRQASCFVLPAIVDSKGDTEGLGVVLIEAAELGLPLVASDVGGISDVVVHGKSGLLVPEKNPRALADALQMLADQPELAQGLVQGARQHIQEHFSWPSIIQKQLSLYERLCLRRR